MGWTAGPRPGPSGATEISLLLAVSPLHGHVAPMLRIGAELVRRGHRVRMLTGARFADAVRAAGIEHVPLPVDGDYDDRRLDLDFPARRRRGLSRARFDVDFLFVRFMAAQYTGLTGAVTARPVDVVLADTGFTGVLPLLLAERPRPAVVGCGVVPLMLSSRDTAPFGMARAPQEGRDYRQLNWIVQRLLFARQQRWADRMTRRLAGTGMPVSILDWPRLTDRLVQLTVPAFEYPRSDLPDNVRYIGPALGDPFPRSALPEWWAELRRPRPVVLATQGTLDNADPTTVLIPTLRGLAGEDVLVVATTGRQASPAVIQAAGGNARLAEHLPYDLLLPHVDVMVTNGGYGGVQHALAHGVPLVVAPSGEDKTEVAARVRWSGTGVDLRTARPAGAAVRAAVRTVLTTPGYREAAGRVRDAIAATPSFDLLEAALLDVAAANGTRAGEPRC
jgi:MGT family glycosyltransferase